MLAPVRLGLIGLGHWGRVCLQALTENVAQGQVVALGSATAKAADFQVPVFADWCMLLDSGLCDGVVITTPAHTHVPIALAAVRRGIAVFIEKPLCTDLDEARAFRDQYQKTPVPILVDHIHLFNPAFQEMAALSKRLGPILSIEAAAGKPVLPNAQLPVLWDWGAHDVAMCLRLLGRRPDVVKARTESSPLLAEGSGEIVDMELQFGPVPVSLRLGTLEQRQRMMRVNCRGGVLVYDDTKPVDKVTLDGNACAVKTGQALQLALSEFCRRIQQADLRQDDLKLALDVVEVLSQADQDKR